MSSRLTLPPGLRRQLAAVGRRVRLLRAVRGLSLLVLVLALTGGAALLADFWFELPATARQAALTAWVGVGTLLLLGFLLPLGRRLDPTALAAAVEEKFPLDERLTSTVELAGAPDRAHGSPALIGLLLRETEAHTVGLDFRPAVPARSARVWAGLASLALLLTFAPALAWPQEFVNLGLRFLLPWRVPATPPSFAFEVLPGDTVVARGRPLTFSVRLIPLRDNVPLPSEAVLVWSEAEKGETRQPMPAQGEHTYSATCKVLADLHYRMEAAGLTSATYEVSAVTPVELAPESPTVTVTPPAYARASVDEETFHGLVDLSALEHSQVTFAFQFTRPALAGTLEWTRNVVRDGKEGTRIKRETVTYRLPLTDDRRGASFTTPAGPRDGEQAGAYRLVLEAEHHIRTERDGGTLSIRPDQPPAILKLSGSEDRRTVLPSEKLPLEVRAADDIGVAEADLEYRINQGPVVRESITLEGRNTREAVGRHVFQLAGKVRESDEVHYRIRVRDNLPAEFGGPHQVYHPADRWLTLKVVGSGTRQDREQEILAQRDRSNHRLEAIKADLLQEQRAIYKVQQESRSEPELSTDQAETTRQLLHQNRSSEEALRDLARDVGTTPALQPLADRAQAVADREMRHSETALHQASTARTPADQRTQHFQEADREVGSALRRLEELRSENERLARQRLDQVRIETLAERQKELAGRAAELAARDPVRDPAARSEAERLKREQAEVAGLLKRLAEQSELLRKALDEARAEQARQLAERARELAQAQRDLARSRDQSERARQARRLADLARQQQELAEQADRLARATRRPAQAAQARPLRPDEAEEAAHALKRGNAEEGMKHQDQSARDLDRLAHDLARAVRLGHDPREAARQLARLQEGLRQRVTEETNKQEGPPVSERLRPLKAEEEAIARAVKRLELPGSTRGARQDQEAAAEKAARAADLLDNQRPWEARAWMKEAKQRLERLARSLPGLEQRRQQALFGVNQLRREQEAIARQVEQAQQKNKPDSDRLLAETARRQAEVAETLSRLDAAGQEARRERVQQAIDRALSDLMDRRREDLAASQQEARRQLDRLGQALSGGKPVDDQVRDLARRQQKLAEEAAQVPADPRAAAHKAEEIQRRQHQVAQETRAKTAPEAPQRKAEAVRATHKAEQAAQARPWAAETRAQMEEATRKLEALARQLRGEESDPERAERLAARQAEAAAEAERQARTQPDKPPSSESQARQREIAAEAKQVRAGEEAQAEKKRALKTLTRAQHAQPQDRARTQREAADALRDLARRLAGEHAGQQPAPPPAHPGTAKPGGGSPKVMAQQLAQQQRELARATQGAQEAADRHPWPARKQALDQDLDRLQRRQRELNREVSRLPVHQAQRTLQQARAAQDRAERALGHKDAGQARHQQDEAASALDALARQLPESAPADHPAAPQDAKDDTASGLPRPEQTEETRRLARQQRELREAVRRAVETGRAEEHSVRENPVGERAQQQARQEDLGRQTGDLTQDLHRLAQQLGRSPPAQSSARQAAWSSQQAQSQMRQAREQVQQGNHGAARQTQEQAAQSLDRAAQQAAQAARQQAPEQDLPREDSSQQASRKAGQEVEEAQGKMTQAQGQISQGQPQGARTSMQQAARALRQAAQQLAQLSQSQSQPSPTGPPTAQGRPPGGLPDLSAFGLDRHRHAGKNWGELPGELRTRIIQDMRANYGEDYARMIKLYFEEMASTHQAGPVPPPEASPPRR